MVIFQHLKVGILPDTVLAGVDHTCYRRPFRATKVAGSGPGAKTNDYRTCSFWYIGFVKKVICFIFFWSIFTVGAQSFHKSELIEDELNSISLWNDFDEKMSVNSRDIITDMKQIDLIWNTVASVSGWSTVWFYTKLFPEKFRSRTVIFLFQSNTLTKIFC